jgi:predicted membrane protein
MGIIVVTVIFCALLLISIFNKGWIFSSALFFCAMGMLIYVEQTVTMNGKDWIVLGLGMVALLALLKTVLNFGSFRRDRL